MKLNELPASTGAGPSRKRRGRGNGSGLGKTAGRGQKGQKSRSGGATGLAGFEGGQMPLQRRLPKRGFHNPFKKKYDLVNVGDLSRVEDTSEITAEVLLKAGLIGNAKDGVKLLGNGEIKTKLTVNVAKASASAIAKIEAAGGKVNLPPPRAPLTKKTKKT